MWSKFKNIGSYSVVLIAFLSACTKGLEPMPDSFRLKMSWSLPVGIGQVSFDKALQTVGIPVYKIGEDVPDWAHYPYVFFQDTLPLNLTEVYNRDSTIEFMEFQLNLWNQFPVDGKAQIFFLDQNGSKLDSLKLDGYFTISSASTKNGKVLKQVFKNYTLKFNRDRIDILKSSDRIVIEAGILPNESLDNSNFQYFNRYYLKVQVGVRVDFKIDI